MLEIETITATITKSLTIGSWYASGAISGMIFSGKYPIISVIIGGTAFTLLGKQFQWSGTKLIELITSTISSIPINYPAIPRRQNDDIHDEIIRAWREIRRNKPRVF